MDYSQLLEMIFRVSITTATLCLPAISVAYFIIASVPKETRRMSTVIGYGSLAAIVLVVCSLFTFVVLCFGHESELTLMVSAVLFVIGCVAILYVLGVLAGFKREIILPLPTPSPPPETATEAE